MAAKLPMMLINIEELKNGNPGFYKKMKVDIRKNIGEFPEGKDCKLSLAAASFSI